MIGWFSRGHSEPATRSLSLIESHLNAGQWMANRISRLLTEVSTLNSNMKI
eukprot:m.463717 g.463717  ORF g.463717 m.463717 type:complete len:51 (+) comp23139_c0_seq1:1118-1270(+)